jgi:hypothetical protein
MGPRISVAAVAFVIVAAFAAPAIAGVEALELEGRAAFLQAAGAPSAAVAGFQHAVFNVPLPAAVRGSDGFTSVTPVAFGVAAAAGASQDVGLEPLLNRHLKTSLKFALGGSAVWVSGGFNRAQKPAVAITEDGKPTRYFDVEALLDSPEILDIGSAKYQLSLSPNMTDLLGSKIVLTNVANKKEQQKITLREMLAAVAAAGDNASIGGQAYKVFYYDDIEDGQASANSRSIAFILVDSAGEFHVFLIPAELIPGDRVALFKMLNNNVAGLQKVGNVLRVFDNPK